jgi:two-component system phosphate regulon sensor histidine kinase PhoR
MNDKRPIPWPGIVLALASGLFMVFAQVDPWIVLAAAILWIGSLWIARPEPVVRPALNNGVQLTRDSMRDLVEHSGTPELLLDRNLIVVANLAAREALGAHIIGQDARVALRHPTAVELLDRPDGGSGTIQGLTSPRSIWHMTRQPINERYWMVELINRTAEADISRAHTDFVANASHELRTPLASIIGYVETLVDEGDGVDPETNARFLKTVLKEARRLQVLVDDLMSLSRIEAEKHDQPSERLDLNTLVAQAAGDAGKPEDRRRIVVQRAAGPLPVRGDRQQLEQLVRNLVDNALKYGDPAEKVTVTLASLDGKLAELKVADRGEGIPAEHLPHLTRRFYRTDPGRSRAAGGTGLGLAIVKHIVERHRGRLDISSRQGSGTTITVCLPLLVEPVDEVS